MYGKNKSFLYSFWIKKRMDNQLGRLINQCLISESFGLYVPLKSDVSHQLHIDTVSVGFEGIITCQSRTLINQINKIGIIGYNNNRQSRSNTKDKCHHDIHAFKSEHLKIQMLYSW